MVSFSETRLRREGFIVHLDGATFHPGTATLVSGDRTILLTRSECRMLNLLLMSEDGSVSRAQIVDAMNYRALVSQSRAVDMIVSMVRVKLRDAGVDARIIAIRNFGYRFEGYRAIQDKVDHQLGEIIS